MQDQCRAEQSQVPDRGGSREVPLALWEGRGSAGCGEGVSLEERALKDLGLDNIIGDGLMETMGRGALSSL